MEIIAHRRNTVAELDATPRHLGVEMDIRSYGDRLIVHHDPFIDATDFVEWLDHYSHGTLILNVKEEGLEDRILALMAQRSIERFFFLDQSFPFLIRTARRGERRCAVRVSEFESIATALAAAPLIDWVWVDCFTHFPLSGEDAAALRRAGLKLCLVSPELQGRSPDDIVALRDTLEEARITVDAVCTKRADLWS